LVGLGRRHTPQLNFENTTLLGWIETSIQAATDTPSRGTPRSNKNKPRLGSTLCSSSSDFFKEKQPKINGEKEEESTLTKATKAEAPCRYNRIVDGPKQESRSTPEMPNVASKKEMT
jgi:hypothetical protein